MHTQLHSSPSHEKFLRMLAASMHQMAQPMSTIQASLEVALLSPTTKSEYKEIAENILGQLRSAVESMQFAARLARFQQPAADVRDVLLSVALEEVISGLQHTLDTAQLRLLFFRPEHEPLINVSPARLRQMLFYVLQAVQGYSRPGDLAKIEIQGPAADRLVLRIKHSPARNSGAARTRPASDDIVDRALALADAIVTGAGGEFKVGTSPLLIVADFPVKLKNKDVAIDQSKVADFSSSQSSAGSHRFFKTS
jgi:hypothetical protein